MIVDYIRTIQELKSVTDEEGNTLIHLAALWNFPEVISQCVEERPTDISAVVNIENKEGHTPIHLAVMYNRLKKNHNDIDYQDSCYVLREQYLKTNSIGFSYPIGSFPYDVFVLLWVLGADINAADRQGNTPLQIAVELYKGTGTYSYDCKNHGEIGALSRIVIALVNIFDADQTIKNKQGLSCNDLIANAPKGNVELVALSKLLAEAKMTKLMRDFDAGKLSLEEIIGAAQKLGCLMSLAERLYHLKKYSNAYCAYQFIESKDIYYVEANEKMVRILKKVKAEGYAQLPLQEKPNYEEALFRASLRGGITELVMELHQAEHQRILSLEEENARLKQELDALRPPQEIHSPSSSSFWRNFEESEDEVANTPPTVSRSLGSTQNPR